MKVRERGSWLGRWARWMAVGAAVLAALHAVGGRAWAQAGGGADAELAAAQAAYGRGDYDEAAGRYASFSRAYPGDPAVPLSVLRVGQCLYHGGRWAQAALYFRRTQEQYPSSPEAEVSWLWLGAAYLRAEAYEEALAAYEGLLQRYPQSAHAGRAAYWKGEVLLRLGRTAEGVAAYEEALRKDLSEAEQAAALYAVGQGRLKLGETEAGEAALRRVCDEHGGSDVAAEAGYLLGATRQAAGDLEEARRAYAAVVAGHPESESAAWAQLGLGACMQAEGDHDAALAAYEKVSQGHPEGPLAADALAGQATCLYHLERWSEAAAAYGRIAAAAKGDGLGEALYWQGTCEALAGEGEKARGTLGRLTQEFAGHPRAGDANVRLGWLEAGAGKVKDAEAAFGRAAASKEAQVQGRAALGLAWTKAAADPTEEALAGVEAALEAHATAPEAGEVALRLAQALVARGDAARAQAVLGRLGGQAGSTEGAETVRLLAAACEVEAGRDAEAEVIFREVLAETTTPETAQACLRALVEIASRRNDSGEGRRLLPELERWNASAGLQAEALVEVAEALEGAGDAAGAVGLYARALELERQGEAAAAAQEGLGWARLGTGDTTGAAAAFEGLRERYGATTRGRNAAAGLLATAEALYAQGAWGDAGSLYRRVLELGAAQAEMTTARYKLAWSLLQQERGGEALGHFLAVTEGAEGDLGADARYQAARLLYARGEPERCEALLGGSLGEGVTLPTAAWALVTLGRARADLGRWDEALKALGPVTGAPGPPGAVDSAWTVTARVLREKGDLAGARAAAQRGALSQDGAVRGEALQELASCDRDAGDLAKAADGFLQAAQSGGDAAWNARALLAAGDCWERLGDVVAARRVYEAIVAQYPGEGDWVDRARVRLRALAN